MGPFPLMKTLPLRCVSVDKQEHKLGGYCIIGARIKRKKIMADVDSLPQSLNQIYNLST